MAGFNGSIEFTEQERAAHQRNIGTIAQRARGYLENIWNEHQDFYRRHHVSKFYGDRNPGLDTREERIAALRAAGAPASLADQLQPTSCVGLTLKSLEAGFNAPGDAKLANAWTKLRNYTRANDLDGSALIDGLQKLGWRVLYWNPNPKDNEKWDAEDAGRRSKGDHAWNYFTATKRGTYYYNKVDDARLLVGFGSNVPAQFREHPFFAGVAHAGYHVFPGFNGEIIEAHSMRALNSIDNMEKSPFNPLARGGGPRWTQSEKYRSGIIAVPPRAA